ncbi:MAG: 2-oxoacid:acceptor oxidoreductase subunit alpha, partial [Ilumatobacteraceae bacterium]
PYLRDEETFARPWAIPGTPNLMHRIGGIEKKDGTGNIDYTAENHERMTRLRAAKIDAVAADIPPTVIEGDEDADLLVLGWGSTWAAIDAAVQRTRRAGHKVAKTHIVHLNPLPPDLGDILGRYQKVLVPELNTGQLTNVLRAKFLVDASVLTKVQGLPFLAREVEDGITDALATISPSNKTEVAS